MERIKKAIPDRPVAKDLSHVLEREIIPVLRQVREAVNANAPAGSVTIEDTDSYADVVFSAAEPDADYYIQLTVEGTTGSPTYAALRVRCTRKDIYGFRIQLQFRPGTGNSVTVTWGMRR